MKSEQPILIIIDSREQLPYGFEKYNASFTSSALPAGDYSILGFEDKIAVERKSLDDLIGCLKGEQRDRFERELSKARAYEFFAVIVEASFTDIRQHNYRSQMKPHAVYQSLTAFMIRYPQVCFLFAGNREGAEYLTYSLLQKFQDEILKRFKVLRKSQKPAA